MKHLKVSMALFVCFCLFGCKNQASKQKQKINTDQSLSEIIDSCFDKPSGQLALAYPLL